MAGGEDEISKNPPIIVQDWGRSMQDSQNLCSFFILHCWIAVCVPRAST